MASKEKKIMPPKLNKFMHPRNPYKTPPSFKKLATAYPEFRAHCSYDVEGKVHLDFKNPDALRALTTCLLRQDFGLEVSIPEGCLVPTLPLRLNYLLWLEDLLALAAQRRGGASGSGQGAAAVVGADIGTGAACVYPLLGATHFGWCMLGTETDPVSYTSAVANVEQNRLDRQVTMMKVEKTVLKSALDHPETLARVSALRPQSGGGGDRPSLSPSKVHCGRSSEMQCWKEVEKAKEGKKEEGNKKEKKEGNRDGRIEKKGREEREEEGERDYTYDFIMCNPPFFSSEEEMDTMAKSKKGRGEPCAAPTGSAQEKVTEGGEVEFIRQMVEQSQLLQDRVRIFTTLIGTKAHVKEVKRLVEAAKPTSFVFTEFCQGRTMRWGVAWTFAAGVTLNEVRSKKEMATNKPIVLLLPRTLMSVYSVTAAWVRVLGWLKALKVKVEVFKSSKYFVSANVKAFKPTWLHQRRRQRERLREGEQQQQHNGKCAQGEDSEDVSQKRRMEEEAADEGKREDKRARIATEEREESEVDGKTGGQKMEGVEEVNEEEEEVEEVDEEEEQEQEVESSQKATLTEQDSQEKPKTETWSACRKPSKGGLRCILRCNFQVKQTGGLISVEAYYLSGSCGKDGVNQLVQYMRNRLTKPPT